MKAEHKAIMARAKKEGLAPSEMAGELLLHDLVQACIAQCSKHEVGFRKMSQMQQEAAIGDMQAALKDSALLAARIISSAGTPTVSMTLKDLKVSNGTITGVVKSTEDNFNELISKVQDKSDVLIVLYEREYFDALDNIQAEKDQKPLPLDEQLPAQPEAAAAAKPAKKKAEPKAIELPPKLIEQATEFVTAQQNATIAGLQNHLHIGIQKASALLKELEAQGVVKFVGDDATGGYELVRAKAEPDQAQVLDDLAADVAPKVITTDLFEQAKAKVIKDQEVSLGGLAVAFGLDDQQAEDLLLRLEAAGVISEEDDLGGRAVYETE